MGDVDKFTRLAAGTSKDLVEALAVADHVDVKTVTGRSDLRTFLHGMFGHFPAWLRFLLWVRGLLAKLLGLWHEAHQDLPAPEQLDLSPGSKLAAFTIVDSDQTTFWIGDAGDKHLDALLAVIREPGQNGRARFHVAILVRYKNWMGPFYFNLIRPFHHLIVARMAKRGAGRT